VLESSHLVSDTRDDGFHEIQLNGKQLLFAVMATMVASAAVFLLGVIVGRNFERGRTTRAPSMAMVDDVRRDPAVAERPPTIVAPGYDPTKAPPPTPPAADRENKIAPAPAGASDPVTSAPAKGATNAGSAAVAATPPAAAPAAAANPKPPATNDKPAASADKPASGSSAVPTGTSGNAAAQKSVGIPVPDDPKQGWLVQVAATPTRDEAESIVKRLTGKGYPAFIVSGTTNVFRVRVGGYKARRDAETVATKLRTEEHISPWITR
jgi:cell division septation protein DedD